MNHYQRLQAILHHAAPLAIAFSGGVDSTLLLKVAHDTLGNNCAAITIDAPYHFRQEQEEARSFTQQQTLQRLIIPFDPATVPNLLNNPPDRCYLCKRALLQLCQKALTTHHLFQDNRHWTLADGSTLDDQTAYRPGSRAVTELRVRSPLAEAGFTKQDIRTLSKELGLASWDKPAQSCLLTRFPHATLITAERLQQVEWAEAEIKKLGFRVVRVRSVGTMAMLEFEKGELAQAILPTMLVQLETICTKAGFSEMVIDPAGYRSGSMDQN
ncbi:MAG: ATP-dependent sacrificial sulfur transferase LarE [Trichlorobacter sp.]|uniref:ATP-dependent sacrificial sulfur transferase LarE n=1 Tax=Trichlorobacter sp. TaxID=2911007 RepID=UPI00256A2704|nr:ATP-dependent sacrificial sulfur transferase LarE [Trichlorobacter sp.]MDK9716281.1 ATP-dependent sacrificial sulfur transferase LarE [Trichlorobacter sp.]